MPSKIPYTDEGWNPVSGCTPCSPGCDACYAKATAERFGGRAHAGVQPACEECETCDKPILVPFSCVTLHPDRLSKPQHWRKPRVVMVPTMGDLFHPDVPKKFITKVWQMMGKSSDFFMHDPAHTYLVLTKRPERMRDYLLGAKHGLTISTVGSDEESKIKRTPSQHPFPYSKRPLNNVWLGVTVCNQAEADEKIPILLSTPAAHYWLSVEPMLGPVDLGGVLGVDATMTRADGDVSGLDQVIVGCESGPKRRPMDWAWVHALNDQCEAAGVPLYAKQWGENEDGTGKVVHFNPEPGELAWR